MKHIFEKLGLGQHFFWVGTLSVVVLVAFVMRFWGIDFGLPFTYHVDEPTYVSAALNLGAGRIGRQLNPPVLPNLLFIEYGLYYVVSRISGYLSSVAEFEKLYRTDPSVFFMLGRITIAFVGVLNVAVVYFIGKDAWNKLTGVLAALFLSVAFLHVRDSHFAVPDVLVTFLTTTTIFFCLRAIKYSGRKYLYLASALAGVAIASKWSVWPVLFPVLYVYLVWEYQNFNRKVDAHSIAIIVGGLVTFLFGFFIASFQLLLQPKSYLSYALSELRSGGAGGFGIWQIDTVSGYLFYLKVLWYGMGFLLLAFSVLGLFRHLYLMLTKRDKISILLVSFPIIYYLLMGSTRHYFARYAIPLVPFLGLFAAEWMTSTTAQIEHRKKYAGWALLGLFTLASSIQPLVSSIRYDILMTRTDTRTIAKSWIEENIPKGSKIAVDWPFHSPPLKEDDYEIVEVGGEGLSHNTVDYYRQNGFDYLIASNFIYNIPLVYEDRNKSRDAFYSSLDNELKMVRKFSPSNEDSNVDFTFDEIYGPMISLWQRDRPGPTLKIYSLSE